MTKNYHATVVIPTYNACELLDYTLNSIVNQNMDLDLIEVIVVDDGSSDDTIGIINNYSKRLNLKYFYQEDRGNRVSLARNTGIKNAEAPIVILIDTGILVSRDFVVEHLKQHKLNGTNCAVIGYVYGFDQYDDTLEKDKSLIDTANPTVSIDHFIKKNLFKDMREDYYRKYKFEINTLPAPWAFFLTCNVSVNKAYLDKVGLFDELFDQRWGVEDLDMGYRLYVNNISFVIALEATALHYPHDSSMAEKFEEEVYNKYLFHQKHNSLATKLFLDSTFIKLNEDLINYSESVQNGSEQAAEK